MLIISNLNLNFELDFYFYFLFFYFLEIISLKDHPNSFCINYEKTQLDKSASLFQIIQIMKIFSFFFFLFSFFFFLFAFSFFFLFFFSF